MSAAFPAAPEDDEAIRPFLRGFVVKEVFEPSNWRSRESLDSYLKRHGVPGISGIDTRALVRRIRDGGAQVGLLSQHDDELGLALVGGCQHPAIDLGLPVRRLGGWCGGRRVLG